VYYNWQGKLMSYGRNSKAAKGSASVSVQYTANPVHSVPAISTSDAGQAATGVLQKTKKTFWRI